MRLLLERGYTDLGTLGTLALLDQDDFPLWTCATIERPWRGNEARTSCIPEGEYDLRLRNSPIVQRTSKGEFTQGWQVQEVPGRSLIMIHIANYASDLLGCIGVGQRQVVMNGQVAVNNSTLCFRSLMGQLQKQAAWKLTITARRARADGGVL